MITFYPRDIGMWRTVFWFDDGSVRGITHTKTIAAGSTISNKE
jgi:hypothetical protein